MLDPVSHHRQQGGEKKGMSGADAGEEVTTVLAAAAPSHLTDVTHVKQIESCPLYKQSVAHVPGNGHVGEGGQKKVDLSLSGLGTFLLKLELEVGTGEGCSPVTDISAKVAVMFLAIVQVKDIKYSKNSY